MFHTSSPTKFESLYHCVFIIPIGYILRNTQIEPVYIERKECAADDSLERKRGEESGRNSERKVDEEENEAARSRCVLLL